MPTGGRAHRLSPPTTTPRNASSRDPASTTRSWRRPPLGTTPAELEARLDASIAAPGSGVEAVPAAQATADEQAGRHDRLAFINQFLMAFAFVALFVGMFIDYNTFSPTPNATAIVAAETTIGPCAQRYDLGVSSGSIAAVHGDGIAVTKSKARTDGLRIGDTIPVRFVDGRALTMSPVATWAGSSLPGTCAWVVLGVWRSSTRCRRPSCSSAGSDPLRRRRRREGRRSGPCRPSCLRLRPWRSLAPSLRASRNGW